MTNDTPAREEREYPVDLITRLAGIIRTSGAMTPGKRAQYLLDEVMAYGEEAAGKVQELATALGLSDEDPTPTAGDLPVTCEVTIPLGSVTDMVRVLSSVPVTARITLRTAIVDHRGPTGTRILTQDELDRERPRLVAIWDETR